MKEDDFTDPSELVHLREKELMEEYFERFGGVRDYLRDIVAEARDQLRRLDDALLSLHGGDYLGLHGNAHRVEQLQA